VLGGAGHEKKLGPFALEFEVGEGHGNQLSVVSG
jgi:hypothetical protein